MRILIISDCGDCAGVAARMKNEGHDIYIYIRSAQYRRILDGIVEKVPSIQDGIRKAPDIIFFDSVGMGKVADKLKEEGWPVVGGSSWADKLELDVTFAAKAMETMGISSAQGYGTNVSTSVWYANGKPVPMPFGSIETKKFLHGESGVATEAQTSVVWAYDRKEPRLVQNSMKKMKPLMAKVGYTGCLTIHGIVKRGRFYGSGFTSHFGYNAIYAFLRILDEPLAPMLLRLAKGDDTPMRLLAGFGYSLKVSIPPYPYCPEDRGIRAKIYGDTKGIAIGGVSTKEWGDRVFPLDCYADSKGQYFTAGTSGIVLETTGYGISHFDAEEEAESLYERLELPQKQARLGDGAKTAMKGINQLASMGYEVPPFLKPEPLLAVASVPLKTHVSKGVSNDITKKPVTSSGAVQPIFHKTYNPGPRSG